MPGYTQQAGSADTIPSPRQKDVIDIFKQIVKTDQKKVDSARLKKKFQFSLIPIGGSAPGGGKAVATAFNASFYTGNQSTTSLSTITFSPWFSFDGKFVLPFRNLVWLPNDMLLAKGDTRFMIYPQYTWGLGGNTNPDNKVLLEYDYLRLYHSFLRKVGKKMFIGAGYDLDDHFNISYEKDSARLATIPIYSYSKDFKQKSISSGPVINFLIDSRRNSVNPPGGVYLSVDYRFNMEFLGSSFNWQSVFIDARKYFSFNKHRQDLLATWGYYWPLQVARHPISTFPALDGIIIIGPGVVLNRTGTGADASLILNRSIGGIFPKMVFGALSYLPISIPYQSTTAMILCIGIPLLVQACASNSIKFPGLILGLTLQ
jgi:hypothetical protein